MVNAIERIHITIFTVNKHDTSIVENNMRKRKKFAFIFNLQGIVQVLQFLQLLLG